MEVTVDEVDSSCGKLGRQFNDPASNSTPNDQRLNISSWSAAEVRKFLEAASEPVVLEGFITHWPSANWTVGNLSQDARFNSLVLMWRLGAKAVGNLWEKDCSYVPATIKQFYEHLKGLENGASMDDSFPNDGWIYADYKHLVDLFPSDSQVMFDIDWGVFGYPDRNGKQSTLWIGTASAETSRHYDTYGCNLVAQLQGVKRWVLNPPEDSGKLYPTRVPFEESSVFSETANFTAPKIQESDNKDRKREAVTSLLTSALVDYSDVPVAAVFNPKEDIRTFEESFHALELSYKCSEEKLPESRNEKTVDLCQCCSRTIQYLNKTDNTRVDVTGEMKERRPLTAERLLKYVTHPNTVDCIVKLMEDELGT